MGGEEAGMQWEEKWPKKGPVLKRPLINCYVYVHWEVVCVACHDVSFAFTKDCDSHSLRGEGVVAVCALSGRGWSSAMSAVWVGAVESRRSQWRVGRWPINWTSSERNENSEPQAFQKLAEPYKVLQHCTGSGTGAPGNPIWTLKGGGRGVPVPYTENFRQVYTLSTQLNPNSFLIC